MPAFSAAAQQLLSGDADPADAMGVDDVSATTSKKILLFDVANLPDVLGSTLGSAGTNVPNYAPRYAATSGSPAAGFGYGYSITIQTTATVAKVGGAWSLRITDPTLGSEDFKWVFAAMIAGAPYTDIFEIDGVGANLLTGKVYRINQVQVLGARVTGYAAMTGTANKAAVYDTASVTLAQLAGRIMQLQADLTAHGIIGA